MKKILDKIYYSPTDLSDFQRCNYHIINDLENIKKSLPSREITETSSPPREIPLYDNFSYQYKIEVPIWAFIFSLDLGLH